MGVVRHHPERLHPYPESIRRSKPRVAEEFKAPTGLGDLTPPAPVLAQRDFYS